MSVPPPISPAEIYDDKTAICVPFILERLRAHQARIGNREAAARPFVVGLNGVQGVGKTTLVRALAEALRRDEGLETLVCSIDDFYLAHDDQAALAASVPDNMLVQVRGQPGTHDLDLATAFFADVLAGRPARAPQYDKSLWEGRGDRLPRTAWPAVDPPVRVVVLEGWCVGFRALPPAAVAARRNGDGDDDDGGVRPSRTLARHRLEHLLFVNARLAAYDGAFTALLDAFIHVDAADTEWVYDWRLQQEAELRARRGAGMTDEQVVRFVDAYYPAYELYTEQLRGGLFAGRDKTGCQLRLVVGKDRRVKETIVI